MDKITEIQHHSKPARCANGHIFGTLENGILRSHVKTHSIALHAIGLDARWFKANRKDINEIIVTVDSLRDSFQADAATFAQHAIERTLRSDFGQQYFLPLKYWRPLQENRPLQMLLSLGGVDYVRRAA